jgi:hypothetical protein
MYRVQRRPFLSVVEGRGDQRGNRMTTNPKAGNATLFASPRTGDAAWTNLFAATTVAQGQWRFQQRDINRW